MKAAAVYVRVSSAEQADDKVSLPDQGREMKAKAAARGYELLHSPCELDKRVKVKSDEEREALAGVFGDPGISGELLRERPGMMVLLEAVRAGQVGAVFVRDTNRLARKERIFHDICDDFEKGGVEVIVTADRDFWFESDDDLLFLGLKGSIDAAAKRWLVKNMARARRSRARRGELTQAVRAFGFRWDKEGKRPHVIEEEAQIVRDIFAMAAGGDCPEEIGRTLSRRGVPRRKGGQWRNPEVQKVLANPAYMGRFVTFTDPETDEETLAKSELCPPAIVDAATWQAAQMVIQAHRKAGRRKLRRVFLLSGFCTCGVCGRRLTIRKPTFEHSYYACNGAVRSRGDGCDLRHIPSADLDADVWGKVKEWAARPEVLRRSAQDTQGELLPRWHRELVRVGETMKHWQTRLRTGREKLETPGSAYSDEDFAATKGEYGLHMADLQTAAEDLEAKIAAAELAEGGIDWTARTLAAAGDLDALDQEGKRRLLSALGAKVTVRTFINERGKLASWEAELGLFTSLAASQTFS